MEAALQQMRDLVSEANLPPAVEQQILWGLGKLPQLYADFARTYDIRYRDTIAGQVQGIINTLATQPSPDAARVLEGLVTQLHAMHERLAIPGLTLKMPAPAKVSRKKKAG
jgi:hypothetical protein